MLSCMMKWGHDYHGIGISPSTVDFCKKLDLSCELVDDTEFWLKNHQNQFDIITRLDVLEHIPKERLIQFVEAIRNSLIKDGLAIFQVPNLQSPFGYLHHFNDITHISGFVEHSLTQVLLSTGFNKMSFYGFEEFYKKYVPMISTNVTKCQNSNENDFFKKKTKVATEETITLIINEKYRVNLLCSPLQIEALSVGYLITEGLIKSFKEIDNVEYKEDAV